MAGSVVPSRMGPILTGAVKLNTGNIYISEVGEEKREESAIYE